MTSLKHLNWRPDLPDFRDKVFKGTSVSLANKIDLRPFCSKVEDQGDLGSCTGNAIAGAIELLEMKHPTAGFKDISRLFIYYNERVYINTVRQDSGAYIRDGIKSVAKIGAAAEILWPYDPAKFARKPSKKAYTDATNRKFSSYLRISTFNDQLACLNDGYPFVFGFSVYESFMSDTVASNGIVPMPQPSEKQMGGHAVLAVGYDSTKKQVIVRNSWGSGWGDKGYFYMPYEYLQNSNLCDDMWTIRG